MTERICSVDDCERTHFGRGYCSQHYQRWRKWGEGLTPPPKAERTCTLEDCQAEHYAQGLCRNHYQQVSRAQARSDPARSCDVVGCEQMHSARGMCSTHYKQWLAAQRLCRAGCGRTPARQGLCRGHWDRWKKYGDPLAGPPIKDRAPNGAPRPIRQGEGYVLVWAPRHPSAQKSGYALEHKIVMAELIGRPLLPGENVHHINGVKDDNRPDNLELWVTMQPSGQRPADLVRYAKEILARYEHLDDGGGDIDGPGGGLSPDGRRVVTQSLNGAGVRVREGCGWSDDGRDDRGSDLSE